jgi:ubiquinone/menaquinone biosynthesis C-methylase UbiE
LIRGSVDLRDAYRDETVARSYIERRFREPLGALLHQRQVDVVKEAIRRIEPRQVLEIAPGPARLTAEIAPALTSGSLTLADASAQMLAEATRRLREAGSRSPRCVQADAFNLPFSTEFELIYTFRLIRHFEATDRGRLYRQIARLIRPGGLLIFDAVNEVVSAPIRAAADPGEYQHFDALLRPDMIRAELKSAGFEVLSLKGVQHRYSVLAGLQVLIAPRSRVIARTAMELIDRLAGGEPLEWIVTCRRE